MFNNTPTLTNTPTKSSSTSIITKNSTIKGDLNSDENLRLDGRVIGEIDCKQRLVIGIEGQLEGSIQTESADISGTIHGDITVFGHLNIQSSAKIFGNIQAKYIQVGEGAVMEGECRVGKVTVERKKIIEKNDLRKKESTSSKKEKPHTSVPIKPVVKQAKEKVTVLVNEMTTGMTKSTPKIKKPKVAPIPAVAAQVHDVSVAQQLFPEGEFKTSVIEQKTVADTTIEKETTRPPKVSQHYTTSSRAPKKAPKRQFNASKFTDSIKQKATIEQATAPIKKAKNERKYGLKLPSISVKW